MLLLLAAVLACCRWLQVLQVVTGIAQDQAWVTAWVTL